MANMNVTQMTKKAAHGKNADKMTVKRCHKCNTKWIEPMEESACVCPKPKKAAAKKEDINE